MSAISEIDLRDWDNLPPVNLNNLGPAWGKQVAGGHYKDKGIQPMQYSMANNLNALQHSIIKYVSRYMDKDGIEGLHKAQHCIAMLIEWEQARAK